MKSKKENQVEITSNETNSNETKPVSAGYRWFNIIKSVIIYALSLCVIVGALFFASNHSPQKSIFGYRYYTVLTSSMEPELSVGDVVIVKLTNAEDIQVGDVITFNPSSDADTYLTHRVTARYDDYEGTGVTCFTTKGDANDTEDGFLLDGSRVIGKVKFHMPVVGYIVRFVQLRWYIVIPLVILTYILSVMLDHALYPVDEEDEEDIHTEEQKTREDSTGKPTDVTSGYPTRAAPAEARSGAK